MINRDRTQNRTRIQKILAASLIAIFMVTGDGSRPISNRGIFLPESTAASR